MRVREITEIVREWIAAHHDQFLGFLGAHLMGSINALQPDDPFPLSSDVDIGIVMADEDRPPRPQEFQVGDIMLETGFYSRADYRQPEQILANPELAPNLVVDSVLFDPTGHLRNIQQAVAADYRRRKWVVARCEWEKQAISDRLELLRQSDPATAVTPWFFFTTFLCGVAIVANLRLPTHRRCLVLLRETLSQYERLDLYEDVLNLLRFAHITPVQATAFLHDTAQAFDRAITVHKTPSVYDFKLRPHLRPYVVNSTQAMIDAGNHREAMLWIAGAHHVAYLSIHNDAPREEIPFYQARFTRVLDEIGFSTPGDWQDFYQRAQAVTAEVIQAAADIIARNPEIET